MERSKKNAKYNYISVFTGNIKTLTKRTAGIFWLLILISANAISQTPEISNEKFSELVIGLSGPGGFFQSDNWITNEMSYLEVLDDFERNKIKGGVYVGVASSQNFSYIAKIKPEIAFFTDIRPQNRMQHYVYKWIFENAETRADFFSLLFSKPMPTEEIPPRDTDITDLIDYFYSLPADVTMKNENTQNVIDLMQNKYKFVLSEGEKDDIKNVMNSFYRMHLNIRYSSGSRSFFPTYAEVLSATDDFGNRSNAFNSREDYDFLRKMHLENRIIPLTGDFGGKIAIRNLGNWMRENNLKLTAYYVSNVEEYVIRNRTGWINWVENVRALPRKENSVIIRWTHENGLFYQDTRLQLVSNFLKDHDAGKYRFYEDLIYALYLKD